MCQMKWKYEVKYVFFIFISFIHYIIFKTSLWVRSYLVTDFSNMLVKYNLLSFRHGTWKQRYLNLKMRGNIQYIPLIFLHCLSASFPPFLFLFFQAGCKRRWRRMLRAPPWSWRSAGLFWPTTPWITTRAQSVTPPRWELWSLTPSAPSFSRMNACTERQVREKNWKRQKGQV